ncbi:MAG: YtoQ family protein [Planctomycetota bacterium]|jgi:YtoQ family protein
MPWNVYLAGEIHSAWRDEIIDAITQEKLHIACSGPVNDHEASDDCGVRILGQEPDPFWHDRKGASLNAIRTRTLIEKADIVVVRFGEKYKQWNAAFDAGYAAALGKKIIIMHPPEHRHALKEVDASALAVCQTSAQVVGILRYVTTGRLPGSL